MTIEFARATDHRLRAILLPPGDAGAWLPVRRTRLRRADHDDDHISGAVYAFSRTRGRWAFQHKLAPRVVREHDSFGRVLSLSGNAAVIVGALGNVYVFARAGSVWMEQQKLVPDDGTGNPEEWRRLLWDSFGSSVAIDRDTVLVGASMADDNGDNSGSAYVFMRGGAGWTEQQKLVPRDGGLGDSFGSELSLSGDTALVGAPVADDRGTNSGAVYVFTRGAAGWAEQQKLLASDGAEDDRFGKAVSLREGTGVVGAAVDDCGPGSGAAYVFRKIGEVWTEQGKLLARGGTPDDFFGQSVSVGSDGILVGAPTPSRRDDAGSAYWFALTAQ